MSYRILRDFIDRDMLLKVREQMIAMHECRAKLGARSGFTLTYEGWLFEKLEPLAALATASFGAFAVLRPDWSSCQLVEPGAGLEFPAHQDIAALQVKSPGDKGCVFWIPLDDIDWDMPTLALVTAEVPMLTHVDDGRGISIIDPALVNPQWDWYVLDNFKIGDVVMLDALTVHKTYVPKQCLRPRLSLDVRAKPQ